MTRVAKRAGPLVGGALLIMRKRVREEVACRTCCADSLACGGVGHTASGEAPVVLGRRATRQVGVHDHPRRRRRR
eukprot:scaffold70637_cov65-Phaeocystis_antarctica.AAC.2